MLLVRLSEFKLDYRTSFSKFVNKMTERQRSAIEIVSLGRSDLEGIFDKTSTYWDSFCSYDWDANTSYDEHVPFARLAGLRRVELGVLHFGYSASPQQVTTPVKIAMRQLGACDGVKISIKTIHGDDDDRVIWYHTTV